MKQVLLFSVLFFFVCPSFAQTEEAPVVIDSLYKEDQFYFGITYNLLAKKPTDVSQTGFSSGFHLGYIKDIPINKRRNNAIGVGLGLSTNSFNHNMRIDKNTGEGYTYTVVDENLVSFSKNKLSLYLVEMPLEYRWRTSDATDYKFWRIYSGFKLGYVVANTSKYVSDIQTVKNSNIKDINDFQFGFTFSAGYNTWNFHLYYALNPLFSKDAKINGTAIDMNAIKIGLMFYIL